MLTYARLLGRMNTHTHFVVVWDCDAADKAEALRQELPSAAKVTPFTFARRQENSITQRGIENIYDEEILKPFSIEKIDFGGKSLEVWPESHRPGLALRQAGVFQSYMAQ